LGVLTKNKREWKDNIPYVALLLENPSVKITATPQWVVPYFPVLQELSKNDPNPVVRIHSVGAIRITNGQLK